MQNIEPVRQDSSDRVNQARAIQMVTDSLGLTDRHAPRAMTAIQVNTEEREVKQGIGELYKAING